MYQASFKESLQNCGMGFLVYSPPKLKHKVSLCSNGLSNLVFILEGNAHSQVRCLLPGEVGGNMRTLNRSTCFFSLLFNLQEKGLVGGLGGCPIIPEGARASLKAAAEAVATM